LKIHSSERTPWKRGSRSLTPLRWLFLPAPSQHRNPDNDKNCRPPFSDDFSDRNPCYAEIIDQKQRSEHNENDSPYAAFHGFSPLIWRRRFRLIRKFLTETHAPSYFSCLPNTTEITIRQAAHNRLGARDFNLDDLIKGHRTMVS
jgi:hypothetical protein